jgi:hypothetical protein
MDMRDLISLVEGISVNKSELAAPDVVGITDLQELGQMLRVANPLIFHNAMRKIVANRSETLNDFEILEVARAFINFVSLGTEEGIRIAMRLGHVTRAHHMGDTDTDDTQD